MVIFQETENEQTKEAYSDGMYWAKIKEQPDRLDYYWGLKEWGGVHAHLVIVNNNVKYYRQLPYTFASFSGTSIHVSGTTEKSPLIDFSQWNTLASSSVVTVFT